MLSACGGIADQQASRSLGEAPQEASTSASEPTSGDDQTGAQASPDQTTPVPDATAEARGSRIIENDSADAAQSAQTPTSPTPEAATGTDASLASETSEPASESSTESSEPVATTAPLPTVTATETAAAPPPTPEPTVTPVSIAVAPTPSGPVPSDDIVVTGPDVDESGDPNVISENGVLACATAEQAIEFIDFGDLRRTAETLQEAGDYAAQAGEPAISALAAELSSVTQDEDAAFDAIVAMLNACVSVGYQV